MCLPLLWFYDEEGKQSEPTPYVHCKSNTRLTENEVVLRFNSFLSVVCQPVRFVDNPYMPERIL